MKIDLSGIQEGDYLLIEQASQPDVIGKVTGITPKGFIKVRYGAGELTFNQDGSERGASRWFWRTARPVTQADLDALELRTAQAKVAKIDAKTLTLAQCKAILAIVAPVA